MAHEIGYTTRGSLSYLIHVGTINQRISNVKAFARFWAKRCKWPNDPLQAMARRSTKRSESTRQRRELHEDELQWLLKAALESPRVDRGMTGHDRAVIYHFVLSTGVRLGDLYVLGH